MSYDCKLDGRCLICNRFGKCTLGLKAKFVKEDYSKYRGSLWDLCKNKNIDKYCESCVNLKECRLQRGLEWRLFEKKNVIINVFPDSDKIEVLNYKEPFNHLVESENLTADDRQRMLKKNLQGEYEPVSDDFLIQDLQRSIRSASKRSKDSFYGYAQANDWWYFITLTFSPEIVDRYDDLAVKKLYSDFQRWCSRKSPDVKMLMVPERHKDGALHFHGLMSDIEFNLIPAKDPHTEKPIYSATGAPLFSIKDWKNGLSTLAVIPPEDNYARVVNYLEKYINKDGNIGYNQKRYFRTRNLLFKNKSILYCEENEFSEIISSLGLVPVKDTDRMVVYRKKEVENNEER